MLNAKTAFEVSRTGYSLLKLEGNCGRTIRRFLQRIMGDTGILNQSFACMDPISPEAFEELCEYAKHVHEKNMEYISEDRAKVVGLVSDKMFCVVQNSYIVNTNIATASVREMKGVLGLVVVLSDHLHAYAANPENAVDTYVNRDAYASAARAAAEDRANERLMSHYFSPRAFA